MTRRPTAGDDCARRATSSRRSQLHPRRSNGRSLRCRRARLAGGRPPGGARALHLASQRGQPALHPVHRPARRRAGGRPALRGAGGRAGRRHGRGPCLTAIAGLADLREDRVEALLIDDASRAAGVRLETLGGLLASDPDAARRLLGDSSALPATDRFAQLTRAGWNQGVAIRVPAGVRLERPIVVRWSAGAPGRGLLTRTIVELGDGAAASIVEELGSSDEAAPAPRPVRARPSSAGRSRSASAATPSCESRASRTSGRTRSSSSTGTPSSARARTSTGRSPSSAAGSSGAGSTTASRAIGAPSSRSRSCSAPTSSCST